MSEIGRDSKSRVQQRYVLTAMVFLAYSVAFAMRINLSFAITRMVTMTVKEETVSLDQTCPRPEVSNSSVSASSTVDVYSDGITRFDWSQELQGLILSSFYFGYFSQIPGGILSQKFGGKYVLISANVIAAILTIITPLSVEIGGATALIVIRILMGISQGPLLPSIATLLSRWIPPGERSLIISISYCGIWVGTISTNIISGILLQNLPGWHSVFYFFGALTIVWAILFVLFCHNGPDTHPFVSREEKAFLQDELGHIESGKANQAPIPWRAMLTSPPVIALILCAATHDWGYIVIAVDLPKYMNDVLHVSIQENGFYTSIPPLMRLIIAIVSGFICDRIITRKYLSVTNARKTFVFIASIIPGIFIVAASYAGCNIGLVVIFFAISVGMEGPISSGTAVNPLDLSPNYVGPLTAVANLITSTAGMFAPYLIGVLTPNSLLTEWRRVFWIQFSMYIAAIVIFSVWGSGQVQSWNSPRRRASDSEENAEEIDKKNIALRSSDIPTQEIS